MHDLLADIGCAMQTTFYGLTFFYESEISFPRGHVLMKEGSKRDNIIYVVRWK